jgi:CHAD domain-containing protein
MTLTDKRISTLFRDLSSIIAGLEQEVTAKRVHRLRTTIRRIESALGYTQPDLGRKEQQALDDLAKLRKRAGRVRDLDVQLKLLGAIANGSTASDRRQLSDDLANRRSRQAERLHAVIQKIARTKFPGHLARLGDSVQTAWANLPQSDGPLLEAKKQVAVLAHQFGSQGQLKTKKLHQVRISLKLVRYLAELADASEEQKIFLQQLKSVQDALGDWHDWEELSRSAGKQFAQRTNRPIVDEIRALFAARQAAARAAVAHLFLQHGSAPARKPPRSVHTGALARRTS